jgi:hypothetical protein
MHRRLWRAEADARHPIGARCRPASRALVGPIAVIMTAVSGCAPVYHDVEYAVYGEEMSGARRLPPSKPRLSLPQPELLKAQSPPDCQEAKTADLQPTARDHQGAPRNALAQQASAAESQPSLGAEPPDRNAELAQRIKLEYERECYRLAEMRARDRLRQLQGSVGEALKSINRAEQQSQ